MISGRRIFGSSSGSGRNSILDYCGTQCFYDNEVKPDPTNPDVVYVEGSYGYNFMEDMGNQDQITVTAPTGNTSQ